MTFKLTHGGKKEGLKMHRQKGNSCQKSRLKFYKNIVLCIVGKPREG